MILKISVSIDISIKASRCVEDNELRRRFLMYFSLEKDLSQVTWVDDKSLYALNRFIDACMFDYRNCIYVIPRKAANRTFFARFTF